MMYGVVGLIIATLTSGIPTLFLALYWLKKHYDLTVDWLSSAKILIASSVTAAITYFAVSQIAFSSWIKLLVGVVIFVLVFIPAVLFSRAITRPDLYNLGGMASGLGSLGRIVTRILNLIEKLMSLLRL
jgi:chromate transport protein ChrA